MVVNFISSWCIIPVEEKRGLAHARLAMASCGVSNLALKLARGATELVLIAVVTANCLAFLTLWANDGQG